MFGGPLRCPPASSRRSIWIDPKQETFPLKLLSPTIYYFMNFLDPDPSNTHGQTPMAPKVPVGINPIIESKSVPFPTLLTPLPLVWRTPLPPPCPTSLPRWVAHSLRSAFRVEKQWTEPGLHMPLLSCLGTQRPLTLQLVWAVSSISIHIRVRGLDSDVSAAV